MRNAQSELIVLVHDHEVEKLAEKAAASVVISKQKRVERKQLNRHRAVVAAAAEARARGERLGWLDALQLAREMFTELESAA